MRARTSRGVVGEVLVVFSRRWHGSTSWETLSSLVQVVVVTSFVRVSVSCRLMCRVLVEVLVMILALAVVV